MYNKNNLLKKLNDETIKDNIIFIVNFKLYFFVYTLTIEFLKTLWSHIY